jgi:hypothetical protein
MKRLFVMALVFAGGCQSYPSANSINWHDLQIDIALRHQYERYSCASRSLNGYSKDSWTYASAAHGQHRDSQRAAIPNLPRVTDTADARQALDQVRELSAKIDLLEDALKNNAGATNQNQTLIVEQIRSLKAELAQLKSSTAAVSTQSPAPQATAVSGIRFGTN